MHVLPIDHSGADLVLQKLRRLPFSQLTQIVYQGSVFEYLLKILP